MEEHLCRGISVYLRAKNNQRSFVSSNLSRVCVYTCMVYSCLAMNESFVSMGMWPTYGSACLHRINPTKTSS